MTCCASRCVDAELERKLIAAQRLVACTRNLREDARSDPLTGIPNRLRLNEDLEVLHARAIRYGHEYAVAIADIDRFKRLNDISGHLSGDAALREVASALCSSMRSGDGIYRFGGEEFVALFPEQALGDAGRAAERLQGAWEARALAHPAGGLLTVSVGVATRGATESSSQEVLGRADRALYMAKARGGNQVAMATATAAPPAAGSSQETSPLSTGGSWTWHPRQHARAVGTWALTAHYSRGIDCASQLQHGRRSHPGRHRQTAAVVARHVEGLGPGARAGYAAAGFCLRGGPGGDGSLPGRSPRCGNLADRVLGQRGDRERGVHADVRRDRRPLHTSRFS